MWADRTCKRPLRAAPPGRPAARRPAEAHGLARHRGGGDRGHRGGDTVLVIQTPKQGVTAQQILAVIPSEMRAAVQLYLDGTIRQWYARGDGTGVLFLVNAKTEDEARAVMETLPLAKEQLMDHAYIPVGPLMPLTALIGPGAQNNAMGTIIRPSVCGDGKEVGHAGKGHLHYRHGAGLSRLGALHRDVRLAAAEGDGSGRGAPRDRHVRQFPLLRVGLLAARVCGAEPA